MQQNSILNKYSLEEIYMIKLSSNCDKSSVLKELENLKMLVEKDLKNIVSSCIEKIEKTESNELQMIFEFPIE